ncbi:hypothetical protein AB0G04_10695 [Actinoplanes sp. NPDC023801]|uniref:hypothetical protein n=1 Tax=Actinoplanes sp. NPDC023801 TaxID=3154595 RepID=UPI0033E4B087
MAILQWTGKGWLSYLVVVASFAAGALVSMPLKDILPEVDGRNPGVVIAGSLVFIVLSPLHWLLDRVLGSDEHSAFGVELSVVGYGQATVGMLLVLLVGSRFAGFWIGLAMVLGAAIAALTVVLWIRGRRRHARLIAAVADRAQLAQARGWQFRPRDRDIATRWQDSFGRTTAYTMTAFGVLTGRYGHPFTVFSTEDINQDIQTVAVVHLPARYPNARILTATLNGTPESPFVRDLLSDQVRAVVARHRLTTWWTQGNDLIGMWRDGRTTPTAGQALNRVQAMVDLARALPPGLADRHGPAPVS